MAVTPNLLGRAQLRVNAWIRDFYMGQKPRGGKVGGSLGKP